jgi:hypothetical protein
VLVESTIFLGLVILGIALAILALLSLGIIRLNSRIAAFRDSFPRGHSIPSWTASDLTGTRRGSPTHTYSQLLIFATHSIVAFSELAAGLAELMAAEPALEVLVLTETDPLFTAAALEVLDLHRVPIVPVSGDFYGRMRVRITPLLVLVDPHGKVAAAGVAGTAAALRTICRQSRLFGSNTLQWEAG